MKGLKSLSLSFSMLFLLLSLCFIFNVTVALDCSSNNVAKTITVDQNGKGNFKTIQQAIDSIPDQNTKWIRVLISKGVFMEQVVVPKTKPCIYFEGAGSSYTLIGWDSAGRIDQNAFSSFSDNIIVKNMAFKNMYKITGNPWEIKTEQAVAARFNGDKTVIYRCSFIGLQDTVWDAQGRHYYKSSYFEGGVDFIFGQGQTIYEDCSINVTLSLYDKQRPAGCITAQRRETPNDPSGFVFKYGSVYGTGKAHLGRPWGPYSRVIFYKTNLSDVVSPDGWDAWTYASQVQRLTYVEANCIGPGSNTAHRVSWTKKLSDAELNKFVSNSYIDEEGWLSKLPSGVFT